MKDSKKPFLFKLSDNNGEIPPKPASPKITRLATLIIIIAALVAGLIIFWLMIPDPEPVSHAAKLITGNEPPINLIHR